MRAITPNLSKNLERHVAGDIAKAPAYEIRNYRELVAEIAYLAHANPDHLLFFRGQAEDIRNKAGASTFYPSIYRADPLPSVEIANRFSRLRFQCSQLARAFAKSGIPGSGDLQAREILQWSIIQHYEIGLTPLLDVTHSLSVACSFAQDLATSRTAYVYVFGLPHLSNRVSINSEHDLINVRLLGICPPDALRPYFQEGYLVGTWDVADRYPDKTVLDFNRRLVAKFAIPRAKHFWGNSFGRVPHELLYPSNDTVKRLCEGITGEISLSPLPPGSEPGAAPHDVGMFLLAWQDVEKLLLSVAADRTGKATNVARAIQTLQREQAIPVKLARELDALRDGRNRIVHGQSVSRWELERLLGLAAAVLAGLQRHL